MTKTPKLPLVSKSNINSNSTAQRYALALMSIEYYHAHKTEPTKSIDNITKDIKDRDNKKRVQDIIRSIPIDFGLDSKNLVEGSLRVSRFIHKELKLDFHKYTQQELRNLMLNVIKKIETKKESFNTY
jgi:hypothetical protein